MAETTENDVVGDLIAQELSHTPFACSSLRRLFGGTANFVYEGILASTEESVLIKHTTNYLASSPDSGFNIDPVRSIYEEYILRVLDGLAPYSHDNLMVKTPRVLYFNVKTDTQVLEYLPNSVDLKSFLLSEEFQGVSKPLAQSLGRALGSWLRHFHNWVREKQQAESREMLAKNDSMKQLKFSVNYDTLINTIDNFPEILENSRDVFEKVRGLAAAELKKQPHDEGYGVIHGDFWTGNVLIPKAFLGQSEVTMFVVDWEMSQISNRGLDLGQMIAEVLQTKLFKQVEGSIWVIDGFLQGYGHLTDDMAFRTVIHAGVHLICWGSRVTGWGSQQQIEEVVQVGKDFIEQGWMRNKAWFEGGSLEFLFKR
ncbi:hypothetical protein N7495_010012 [Penicillium taxi]|uniref:uncharacterized protein n=1 Tax=Penicillium taxi TaxID=168475 RepID=UPI00254541AD|nr:uncharacterized protein N7495_010012 [Penicillium taxi]KAJ5885502.1 hypothetical protein N7495_010012 [Penicillium taxi]